MNEHKSHEEITLAVEAAKRQVQVGMIYHHYKDYAKTYKPLHLATLEATDELCVVYQAQYGPGHVFVRPLAEWLEHVEWQGKVVPRFSL